jgi:hypothetical protein
MLHPNFDQGLLYQRAVINSLAKHRGGSNNIFHSTKTNVKADSTLCFYWNFCLVQLFFKFLKVCLRIKGICWWKSCSIDIFIAKQNNSTIEDKTYRHITSPLCIPLMHFMQGLHNANKCEAKKHLKVILQCCKLLRRTGTFDTSTLKARKKKVRQIKVWQSLPKLWNWRLRGTHEYGRFKRFWDRRHIWKPPQTTSCTTVFKTAWYSMATLNNCPSAGPSSTKKSKISTVQDQEYLGLGSST